MRVRLFSNQEATLHLMSATRILPLVVLVCYR